MTDIMTVQRFNEVFENQVETCRMMLVKKAEEYATVDRLHNFRVAAALRGTDMKAALGGMMVKHTTSIYDMIESPEAFPMDLWDEKITDHLNYLLLLKAVLMHEHDREVASTACSEDPGVFAPMRNRETS